VAVGMGVLRQVLWKVRGLGGDEVSRGGRGTVD